ncbi:MAG: NAD(P)/FAD-dependent oxidoreductase [Chitinophagaceae bacterium]
MASKKVVIIGGGAAGFFCAIQIAEQHPDWDIRILEKSSKILSKVKVSGGGRCNVTHACPDVEKLLQKYPRGQRFLKKSFYQFATQQTIEWFAKNGVKLHTEKDGRMFPMTNDSETIIQCLMQKVNQYKIQVCMNHDVTGVKKSNTIFEITLGNGQTMQADAVCMATGGMLKSNTFPWLLQMGHSIIDPVPSLFTFNVVEKNITTLMGVAVENATIQWKGTKWMERGPLLITHWGISGPAAIKLSAWCAREMAEANYEGAILINWTPEYNEQTLKMEWLNFRQDYCKREMGSKNPFDLPQRLWHYFLQASQIDLKTKWADLKNTAQQQLIQHLTRTTLNIKGKTTFKEEFVTCGGVDLNDIDSLTMESKMVAQLHFAGEMMDVDGITGGFNFQHAWTSGWLAAQHIGALN